MTAYVGFSHSLNELSIPFTEYGLVTSWVLKRISYLVLTLQEQLLDRCCVSSNISSVSFEAKFKLSQPKRETFSYVFLVGWRFLFVDVFWPLKY